MTWAFNQVLKAIEFINDAENRSQIRYISDTIVDTINNKSIANAKQLIKDYKLKLPVITKEVITV